MQQGMNTQERTEIVRRRVDRNEANVYALVLSARGISSAIVQDAYGFSLFVAPDDVDQAKSELAAYDSENQVRSTERKRVRSAPLNVEFVLGYWALLLFFFAAGRSDAFSI